MKIKIHVYNPGVLIAIALIIAAIFAGQANPTAWENLPGNAVQTAPCADTDTSICSPQMNEVVPFPGYSSPKSSGTILVAIKKGDKQPATWQYLDD